MTVAWKGGKWARLWAAAMEPRWGAYLAVLTVGNSAAWKAGNWVTSRVGYLVVTMDAKWAVY